MPARENRVESDQNQSGAAGKVYATLAYADLEPFSFPRTLTADPDVLLMLPREDVRLIKSGHLIHYAIASRRLAHF